MKQHFHRDRNWKESNILKIEISCDRYNVERRETLKTKYIFINYVLIRNGSV